MYAEPHIACQQGQQGLGPALTEDKDWSSYLLQQLALVTSCTGSFQLHSTSIELQHGLGWKGPLKAIQSNSPFH